MRGIQINNYFNNHITLDGKKVTHHQQAVPHSARPKPLQHPPDNIRQEAQDILKRSPHKQNGGFEKASSKKRSETLLEVKRKDGKGSVQRGKYSNSSQKRNEVIEEESREEQAVVNVSHKKVKQSSSKGGLGARSKSTIIRNNHENVNRTPHETIARTGHDTQREVPKRQGKKLNSNPTSESVKPPKNRRKKSQRTIQTSRQFKPNQTTKSVLQPSRDMLAMTSKQVLKKQKLSIRLQRKQGQKKQTIERRQATDKKSGRGKVAKSGSSVKMDKPGSAREMKKKKNYFLEDLREKYQNQMIVDGQTVGVEDDVQFMSVINNLEKVLTSVGSKQKLKKELAIINDKLKEFKLHSDDEEINQKNLYQTLKGAQQQTQKSNQQTNSQQYQTNQHLSVNRMKLAEEMPSSISRDISKEQSEEDSEQEDQKQFQMFKKDQQKYQKIQENRVQKRDDNIWAEERDLVAQITSKNPLVGKRQHMLFEDIQQQRDEAYDRRRQIEQLRQFKQESQKMMQKAGISLPPRPPQNPNKVQSVNDKSDLFAKDANTLIENVSLPLSIENHSRLNADSKESSLAQSSSQPLQQQRSGTSQKQEKSHHWQEKYPPMPPKSPKFDQGQLLSAISLKEQFMSSRHDKMSELVKTMFQKRVVSPRSFQSQMRLLKEKHQQENLMIESYRRQAEQLSSLISEIKRDKEEIQGIDELIRNQQWQQAQKLVHVKNQNHLKEKVDQKHEFGLIQTKLPVIQQDKHESNDIHSWQKDTQAQKQEEQNQKQEENWQKDQGWQRVKIEPSEVQNNQFVDLNNLNDRIRRDAQANPRNSIDRDCGGTQESQDLPQHLPQNEKVKEQEECIYYQGEEDDKSHLSNSGGLIRLMQVEQSENNFELIKQESTYSKELNEENVIDDELKPVQSAIIIEQNSSLVSVGSSTAERKGFVTNLYFIKEYCIAICQFVRDRDEFKEEFKFNVSLPLQFDLVRLLAALRPEDKAEFVYSRREGKPAIETRVWQDFNANYQSLKFNNILANQSGLSEKKDRYIFEKQMQLVFVKMIYDVLNESLNYQRPGALNGKGLPWHQTSRHLKNLKQLGRPESDNLQAYDLMFGVAIARIIQWGSCLCGFLPDTVQLQNTEIDQSYVNHIRETRMAFLLQKMMAEEESIMINFQMQQTEVQFTLASLIYEDLMEEVAGQIEDFLLS